MGKCAGRSNGRNVEQHKGKRMKKKKMKTVSETSETTLNVPTFK